MILDVGLRSDDRMRVADQMSLICKSTDVIEQCACTYRIAERKRSTGNMLMMKLRVLYLSQL